MLNWFKAFAFVFLIFTFISLAVALIFWHPAVFSAVFFSLLFIYMVFRVKDDLDDKGRHY